MLKLFFSLIKPTNLLQLFKDKEFLSSKKFDKFQDIILSEFFLEKFNLRFKIKIFYVKNILNIMFTVEIMGFLIFVKKILSLDL